MAKSKETIDIKPQEGPQEAFLATKADIAITGGCVDADTEFLTPKGWKRIADYSENDVVANWRPDGGYFFAQPVRYIDVEAPEPLIHFTGRRLDMMLSPDHRMPLYNYRGKFEVLSAQHVSEHLSRRYQPVFFEPENAAGVHLSDDEIRLMVAVHADGSFESPTPSHRCRISLRKQRKKDRLLWLLSSLGIDYYEYHNPNRPTEVRYTFDAPLRSKTFDAWRGITARQAELVIEEMSHWDGAYSGATGGDIAFNSTIKRDADFIQYCAHIIGRHASITRYDDREEGHRIVYRVNITRDECKTVGIRNTEDTNKMKVVIVSKARQYCFETDTGFWIARRNGKIFCTGNSAGSGKTHSLLMEPLRHMNNSEFSAVFFRRTSPQLTAPGGLWDEAMKMYTQLGAEPFKSPDLQFRFPEGAVVRFRHLQYEDDKYNWQGSQIPLLMFDEITHFTWGMFTYMISRNRSTCGVNPYIRATCNPDPDHWLRTFLDWWIGPDGTPIQERSGVLRWMCIVGNEVHWGNHPDELKAQFGDDCEPLSVTFIPATLDNNQELLKKDPGYRAKLKALPKHERERLLGGNWDAREVAGVYFRREWFGFMPAAPSGTKWVRYYDRAATEKPTPSNPDPDYTAGALVGITPDKRIIVGDLIHFRGTPQQVERTIVNTAQDDDDRYGMTVVGIEADPGQAGKMESEYLARQLQGHSVKIKKKRKSKVETWMPFSSQAEVGNVYLLPGDWHEAFFNELESLGGKGTGYHDDIADAVSGGYGQLFESRYTLSNL